MAGKGFLLLLIGWLSMVTVQAENRKVLFDKDWHFRKGAVAGAEKPVYDDSAWRILDLPHDWSIEPVEKEKGVETIGPFSKNSAGGPATGQTVGGEGWYRKSFVLAPEDAGKRVELYFEGVYNQAEVWVNGEKAGYNVYGYSSFRCDITPYCLPAGKKNVVAVRVVNEGKNSRWYTGSGIYRHVWLLKTNQIRLDAWETAIATENLHEGKAEISIATRVISGIDEQYLYKWKHVFCRKTVCRWHNRSMRSDYRLPILPSYVSIWMCLHRFAGHRNLRICIRHRFPFLTMERP